MARKDPPDLVIADIGMPQMDGFTLLTHLRDQYPDLPVVAISGYVDADEAQDYAFDAFVEKPVRLEEFRKLVGGTLTKSKSGPPARRLTRIVERLRGHPRPENLDGSGYLAGTTNISEAGPVLGIIDFYEALINDGCPCRRPMEPLAAPETIKADVEAARLSRAIFERFADSLI